MERVPGLTRSGSWPPSLRKTTLPLELGRPDARVDLRRVEPRVAKQGAHLLEVVVLLEDFHGDTVAQVVGLELGDADHPAVDLAQPPNVLARHRGARLAHGAPAPRRPEERRLGPDLLELLYQNPLHVRLQELHDRGGQ